MFYYFDKHTRRCIFTCSSPLVFSEAICIEAAVDYSGYSLDSLSLDENNNIVVDEELELKKMLETAKEELKNKLDSLEKDLDVLAEYEDADVTEAKQKLNRVRYEALKTVKFPLPTIPNIMDMVMTAPLGEVDELDNL